MLGVFGRTEVTGGTLAGTIKIGGTLGQPTAKAHLEGTKLTLPPGPRNTPVKVLDSITVDGRWDGVVAYVTVDGVEINGVIVERGYACVLHIPPNGDDRVDEFEELELRARQLGRGLWAACDPRPC